MKRVEAGAGRGGLWYMSGIAYNSGIGKGGDLLKTFTNSKSMSLRRAKHLLISLLLVLLGVGQSPAVNAQAEAMAPLVQMGVQLAAAVVPMVIPVVVTGAVMGARAAAMAPAYIKEKVSSISIPRPHLRKKKGSHGEVAQNESDSATENVTGEVVDPTSPEAAEDSEAAPKPRAVAAKADSEEEAVEEEAPKRKAIPRTTVKPMSQRLRDEDPQAAKDPSDWYND